MIEFADIIKTVFAVLAILLLAAMLWLVVALYDRTKQLQAALKLTKEDFSGISVQPTVPTVSVGYPYDGHTAPDAIYPYDGPTFNYDPRYTYDPRNPYEPRYIYNPPRFYPTPNGGFYYPTTFPPNSTVAQTQQQ